MSGSGERKGEGMKEMDARAQEKGRGAKEEEDESEVWGDEKKLLFFF